MKGYSTVVVGHATYLSRSRAMEQYGRSRLGRISAAASLVLLSAACHGTPLEVDSSALQVKVDVTPREIVASASPDGGLVQVVVSVTNPRLQPVVVQLGGPPYKSGQIPAAETSGIGFGVRVMADDNTNGVGPSEWTFGQPTFTLGPRATERHTFVIQVRAQRTSGLSVTPGSYHVIASFGRQEVAPIELHVLP